MRVRSSRTDASVSVPPWHRVRRVEVESGLRRHRPGCGQRGLQLSERSGIHIGGHHSRAGVGEKPGQVAADLADTFDTHDAAGEIHGAPDGARGSLHGPVHTPRRQRGAVPGTAGTLAAGDDVPGRRPHDVHVLGRRADVTGGDVPAAQSLHEFAEGAEQSADFSFAGSPMMTALPPPSARPATAAL